MEDKRSKMQQTIYLMTYHRLVPFSDLVAVCLIVIRDKIVTW